MPTCSGSGREPLAAGRQLELRVGTRAVAVRVAAIIHALDVDRLVPGAAHDIATNGLGRVTLRCDVPVALDDATECSETGRFVLADGGAIVGGGLVDASRYPDQRHSLRATSRNARRASITTSPRPSAARVPATPAPSCG